MNRYGNQKARIFRSIVALIFCVSCSSELNQSSAELVDQSSDATEAKSSNKHFYWEVARLKKGEKIKVYLRTAYKKHLIQPIHESNVFTRLGKPTKLANFTFVDAKTKKPIRNLKEAIGRRIGIKSAQGLFLSSENGKKAVQCNRKYLSTWETFVIRVVGKNKFSFMGNNQKWLSSENGNKPMRCDRNEIKEWELFTIKSPKEGVFQIHSLNHNDKIQWITVEPKATVVAKRSRDKEKFALNFIMLDAYNNKTKSRKIAIEHIQSKTFLSSENGLLPISFTRKKRREWETFVLHGSKTPGFFAIQGNNMRYLSAGTSGMPMYCKQSYPKAKDLAEMEKLKELFYLNSFRPIVPYRDK